MRRDIDYIIDGVKRRFPDVDVQQLQVTHPADDDGLWFFALPNSRNDIQIESSSGMCPFLIEHSDMKSSSDAWHAHTVDEAIAMISSYLEILRARE